MKLRALLLAWLAACGLQEIDLASSPRGDDVLVLEGVPAERLARFAIATEAKPEPKLALGYPPDGAALPMNSAPFTFVWAGAKMPAPPEPPPPKPRPPAEVVYELHLRCAAAELRVYSIAGELTLPAERWRRLLAANGCATLEVQLRALDAKGAMKVGPLLSLEIRAALADGALYYVAERQGVVRAQPDQAGYELISQEAPCAGCRPVARDGTVRVVESEPEVVVEALGSGTRATLTSTAPLAALDWASLSPDGANLVASGQGQLALYARDPLSFSLADLGYATDPDWGPDASLAVAIDTRPPDMMMMMMGLVPNAIVRVQLADGTPSSATTLVESAAPDETLRAPSFSPDGRFLAFARQKGKGDMTVLAWVDLASSVEPALQGELANVKARAAMPSWLPSSAEREYWLIFASSRDGPFGKLMPEQEQLWVLGVERQSDDSLRALGEPFWLPCQDPATSNHRALFAPR
jgi:WD40-like Beta Propeller Repeat